jgi:hemerythrin
MDIAIIDNRHRLIVDYTHSHLAFEDALMEQAGHDSSPIQQKNRQAFCNRIDDVSHRADSGEDIAAPSARLLRTRLTGHIDTDDSCLTDLFRQRLAQLRQQNQGAWLSDVIRRYFGQALIG